MRLQGVKRKHVKIGCSSSSSEEPEYVCAGSTGIVALARTRSTSAYSLCLASPLAFWFGCRAWQEVRWPSAEERAAHARFMGERGHPDMNRVVYIAGSTKVGMRIPFMVRS